MCTARALATSVLVGMQPTLTQVPPTSLRSISAALIPSLSRRAHSAGAACPVPMTMASKRSAMAASAVYAADQEQAVVGGHRDVLLLLKVLPFAEREQRLDVAQAALRV